MTAGNTLDIVCGIVYNGSKLLISQRKQDTHLGGYWEFPGGKRRADESAEDAVKRELWEEVALDVTVGALVYETRFQYPERTVRLRFFRCEKQSDAEPSAREVAALCWVAPEDLHEYSFPPANEELIAILQGTTTSTQP